MQFNAEVQCNIEVAVQYNAKVAVECRGATPGPAMRPRCEVIIAVRSHLTVLCAGYKRVMFSVQCAVCRIQVCCVQCAVCSVQDTSVLCAVCSAQDTSVQCAVCSMNCAV